MYQPTGNAVGGGAQFGGAPSVAAAAYVPQNITEQQYYNSMFKMASIATVGRVTGGEAVVFLKRSRVDVPTLKKIWDIADWDGKGFLDYARFSVALRLITLKQRGFKPLTPQLVLQSQSQSLPLPQFEGIQLPPPPAQQQQVAATQPATALGNMQVNQDEDDAWRITPEAKEKYLTHFNQLDVGRKGHLTGVEARTFMMKSNLPHPVLGKIWDMSDTTKNGCLSKSEFCIAFHLIVKISRYGKTLPPSLPRVLFDSAKMVEGNNNNINTTTNGDVLDDTFGDKLTIATGDELQMGNNNQAPPPPSPNTKAKKIADAVAGALGIDMSIIEENSKISPKNNINSFPIPAAPVVAKQNMAAPQIQQIQEEVANQAPSPPLVVENMLQAPTTTMAPMNGNNDSMKMTSSNNNFKSFSNDNGVKNMTTTSSSRNSPINNNNNNNNNGYDSSNNQFNTVIVEESQSMQKTINNNKNIIQRSVKGNEAFLNSMKVAIGNLKDERESLMSLLNDVEQTLDTVEEDTQNAMKEENNIRNEVKKLKEKLNKKRDVLWKKRGEELVSRGRRQELTHLKKVISEEIKQVKAEIRDFNDSAKDLDHLRAKHDQGIESMENEIESLKNKLAEAKLQREQAKSKYHSSKSQLHRSTGIHEQRIAEKSLLSEQVSNVEQSFNTFDMINNSNGSGSSSSNSIEQQAGKGFDQTQFVNLAEEDHSFGDGGFGTTTTGADGFGDIGGGVVEEKSGGQTSYINSSSEEEEDNNNNNNNDNDTFNATHVIANKAGDTFGNDAFASMESTNDNAFNITNVTDNNNKDGDAFGNDAFASMDSTNNGTSAFDAFDTAENKEEPNNTSSTSNDGFNVPDEIAFDDNAFPSGDGNTDGTFGNTDDNNNNGEDAFDNAFDSFPANDDDGNGGGGGGDDDPFSSFGDF